MKQSKVIIIAGGIASGKSTISEILSKYIEVIDLDILSRQVATYADVITDVYNCFGCEFISSNRIDRKKLASFVFTSQEKADKLNSIFHPKIYALLNDLLEKSNSPIVAVQCPLFSDELKKLSSIIWYVTLPLNEQQARIMRRDGISLNLANDIISRQYGNNQWIDLANEIIVNDGDLKKLEEQIEKLAVKYNLQQAQFNNKST